jgi:hypothetical protein
MQQHVTLAKFFEIYLYGALKRSIGLQNADEGYTTPGQAWKGRKWPDIAAPNDGLTGAELSGFRLSFRCSPCRTKRAQERFA